MGSSSVPIKDFSLRTEGFVAPDVLEMDYYLGVREATAEMDLSSSLLSPLDWTAQPERTITLIGHTRWPSILKRGKTANLRFEALGSRYEVHGKIKYRRLNKLVIEGKVSLLVSRRHG